MTSRHAVLTKRYNPVLLRAAFRNAVFVSRFSASALAAHVGAAVRAEARARLQSPAADGTLCPRIQLRAAGGAELAGGILDGGAAGRAASCSGSGMSGAAGGRERREAGLLFRSDIRHFCADHKAEQAQYERKIGGCADCKELFDESFRFLFDAAVGDRHQPQSPP